MNGLWLDETIFFVTITVNVFTLLLGFGLFPSLRALAYIRFFNTFKHGLKDHDPHTIFDYRIFWISDIRIDTGVTM